MDDQQSHTHFTMLRACVYSTQHSTQHSISCVAIIETLRVPMFTLAHAFMFFPKSVIFGLLIIDVIIEYCLAIC
jgi:hypothetical protein